MRQSNSPRRVRGSGGSSRRLLLMAMAVLFVLLALFSLNGYLQLSGEGEAKVAAFAERRRQPSSLERPALGTVQRHRVDVRPFGKPPSEGRGKAAQHNRPDPHHDDDDDGPEDHDNNDAESHRREHERYAANNDHHHNDRGLSADREHHDEDHDHDHDGAEVNVPPAKQQQGDRQSEGLHHDGGRVPNDNHRGGVEEANAHHQNRGSDHHGHAGTDEDPEEVVAHEQRGDDGLRRAGGDAVGEVVATHALPQLVMKRGTSGRGGEMDATPAPHDADDDDATLRQQTTRTSGRVEVESVALPRRTSSDAPLPRVTGTDVESAPENAGETVRSTAAAKATETAVDHAVSGSDGGHDEGHDQNEPAAGHDGTDSPTTTQHPDAAQEHADDIARHAGDDAHSDDAHADEEPKRTNIRAPDTKKPTAAPTVDGDHDDAAGRDDGADDDARSPTAAPPPPPPTTTTLKPPRREAGAGALDPRNRGHRGEPPSTTLSGATYKVVAITRQSKDKKTKPTKATQDASRKSSKTTTTTTTTPGVEETVQRPVTPKLVLAAETTTTAAPQLVADRWGNLRPAATVDPDDE